MNSTKELNKDEQALIKQMLAELKITLPSRAEPSVAPIVLEHRKLTIDFSQSVQPQCAPFISSYLAQAPEMSSDIVRQWTPAAVAHLTTRSTAGVSMDTITTSNFLAQAPEMRGDIVQQWTPAAAAHLTARSAASASVDTTTDLSQPGLARQLQDPIFGKSHT